MDEEISLPSQVSRNYPKIKSVSATAATLHVESNFVARMIAITSPNSSPFLR